MDQSWQDLLREEWKKPYVRELKTFLEEERTRSVVYPPKECVYAAFQMPFEAVKVVIVGQDPYHGEGQAHGLSFSVPEGVDAPPSLKNIFKEAGIERKGGCLESWMRQGVLLLNATLTVRKGEPKSHFGRGWERFTDRVIELINERKDPVVFMLWGKPAQEKGARVGPPHLVLKAPHPSPFSAYSGFFGCGHFVKANEFLKSVGKEPIVW